MSIEVSKRVRVRHEGKTYDLSPAKNPHNVPPAVVELVKGMGALGKAPEAEVSITTGDDKGPTIDTVKPSPEPAKPAPKAKPKAE